MLGRTRVCRIEPNLIIALLRMLASIGYWTASPRRRSRRTGSRGFSRLPKRSRTRALPRNPKRRRRRTQRTRVQRPRPKARLVKLEIKHPQHSVPSKLKPSSWHRTRHRRRGRLLTSKTMTTLSASAKQRKFPVCILWSPVVVLAYS